MPVNTSLYVYQIKACVLFKYTTSCNRSFGINGVEALEGGGRGGIEIHCGDSNGSGFYRAILGGNSERFYFNAT